MLCCAVKKNDNINEVNMSSDKGGTPKKELTMASNPGSTNDQFTLFDTLLELCNNNIEYFRNDDTEPGLRLHGAFVGLVDHIKVAVPLAREIDSFAAEYDFDEETPGNGFRSFVYVVQSCGNRTLRLAKDIISSRNTLLFRKSTYVKDAEAYNALLASLCTCLKHLITLHEWTEKGELFSSDGKHSTEELLSKAETINQYAFYGRCLGFQFCESIKPVLRFICICMAGFSEAYYSEGGRIAKATSSVYTSGKYFLDPELRARRIVNISQSASVDFCKAFWFLAESELMQSIPSVVGFKVKVNRIITIPPEPLQLKSVSSDKLIDIPIPTAHIGCAEPIQARLISAVRRKGMIGEKLNKKSKVFPPANGLLFHCHGGGFVAQSSKSHELYLREWAVNLNVPILSIDYSLAPKAPFPRALEEVFYAYCWALQNCELLGTTGERIIFAGDSAGANLNLGCAMKTIDLGIRKPDGIFLAYCPVLVSFVPSPARLLCLMDPLLPFGFMMRCLKAYACPAKEIIDENKRRLEEKQQIINAKVKKNSLKKDNESEHSNSNEDVSGWERISIIKSPVSDISDTMAVKSQMMGNTIEMISPDESNTVTSLEDDSQPISMQKIELNKNECHEVTVIDDLDMEMPSDMSSEQNTNQYVSDFIERYVLDTRTENGQIEPILRPARSPSEENIILDVGKEAVNVQNIQKKVQDAASNIVNVVSSTFTNITTSKKIGEAVPGKDIKSNLDALIARSPSDEFIFSVPRDPYLSPYWAKDDLLKQLPPTNIITLVLDPCLDDCVMFAKRLKKLNNSVALDILPGLPHGFLNFAMISKEAHEGSKLCIKRIQELLDARPKLLSPTPESPTDNDC